MQGQTAIDRDHEFARLARTRMHHLDPDERRSAGLRLLVLLEHPVTEESAAELAPPSAQR